MTKKLSFILPIYNVEVYLPQCLDSILCQFTPECEMILVDDGTKDNCGKICDDYQGNHSDIPVSYTHLRAPRPY